MKRSRVFAAFAITAFAASSAHAGAWTQGQGRGQVILTSSVYRADSLYDNQGRKTDQPTYAKAEFNPYVEYGLNDNLTVGANLMFQRAYQQGAPGMPSFVSWGVADSEFFLRRRLWASRGFVVSAEPMVKLPSPNSRRTPAIGGRHPDAGMGISAGYGFKTGELNHFVNLDTGYRYRFGDPKDQARFALTAGGSVTPSLMIMPQVFVTRRLSSPTAATFTQSSGDDYNQISLQLSAVYKMNDRFSLQLGGFKHVDGKNAGAGKGALLSLWTKF